MLKTTNDPFINKNLYSLLKSAELKTSFSRKSIISFLEKDDEFYEGAYLATTKWSTKNEKWYHIFPLWILNYGYVFNVRKYVQKGSTVLELGCGGGINYFNDRYKMIGLDLSYQSLEKTPYPLKLQASATQIPLKNESIDAVISSFFWEHIPEDMKTDILKECQRVLKPHGRIVFFYDVETDNPLIRKLKKKDINLYNQLFIDKDGHLGYHTPAKNKSIFEKMNFKVLKHFGMERLRILRISELKKLKEGGVISHLYFNIIKAISSTKLKYVYDYIMMIANYTIGRLFPDKNARIIVSVLEKKNLK